MLGVHVKAVIFNRSFAFLIAAGLITDFFTISFQDKPNQTQDRILILHKVKSQGRGPDQDQDKDHHQHHQGKGHKEQQGIQPWTLPLIHQELLVVMY